ncbi:MAG: hypothetical protein EZS28_054659, partial [Streblomastix strix]
MDARAFVPKVQINVQIAVQNVPNVVVDVVNAQDIVLIVVVNQANFTNYKVILIMSAFFVGSFFFWSILMINPNGFENILSIEKQSL